MHFLSRFWFRGPCYASLIVLCLSVVAAGCGADEPQVARQPGEAETADSVVAFLGRLDADAMRRSFVEVAQLSFTRYERTEQFDVEGHRLAFEEQIMRRDGPSVRVIDVDSAGSFDFGYVRPFASGEGEEASPSDLADFVVPEDPAYASPRNVEAFVYEPMRDTTLYGRDVRIVRIRARPGVGDKQSIRRVQLYVDEAAYRLVGIYVERVDTALWFREESALFVSVEQLPSGRWVPRQTRFETLIKLPFRPAQRFRSVTSYYDFGRRT